MEVTNHLPLEASPRRSSANGKKPAIRGASNGAASCIGIAIREQLYPAHAGRDC